MKLNPTRNPLHWLATVFLFFYFLTPKLSPACVSTNYQSIGSQPIPVSQVTNIISISPEVVPPEPEDQKLWPICLAVLIAVAVVGYIIYQIIQMCKKIPPPDSVPAQPTNSPPFAINPTTGPGEASAVASTRIERPNVMTYSDISSLGYVDSWAKTPSQFIYFWSVGISTSTNLADWEDTHYRVNAFVSDTGTFFSYLHFGTNYYNCYFTESTNAIAYFNLSDQPQRPVQFFRLNPQ